MCDGFSEFFTVAAAAGETAAVAEGATVAVGAAEVGSAATVAYGAGDAALISSAAGAAELSAGTYGMAGAATVAADGSLVTGAATGATAGATGATATSGWLGMSNAQLAQLGLSAGMGIYNYTAQSKQAGAVKQAAYASQDNQLEALGLQRDQINEQYSDAQFTRGQQAQFALAKMRVSAGEAGVSGNSVNSIERENAFNASHLE